MKRCPTCNRTYTDPSLSFCIEDGTPLIFSDEDETTSVSPREYESTPAYQPPGPYVPPEKRRKVWPWVVGILGMFIFGIVAISIVAVVVGPRLIRSAQDREPSISIGTAPTENSNNAAEPVNSNVNTSDDVDAPPANHDLVLAQLTDLEHEWTAANINADKQKLAEILADDYVSKRGDGQGLQTKADYIRTIQRDTAVERWEFSDLKLKLMGDRATLSGRITYVVRRQEFVFDFTDKFVWRDGRWQATGSEVTPLE